MMRYSADFCSLSNLLRLTPFSSFAGLLTQVEDCICCFVQQGRPANWHLPAKRALSATSALEDQQSEQIWVGPPRRYVVHYRLTLAELCYGQVVGSYVAPCVRLFDTDELNVIWAELVEEIDTAPGRLGLEITALDVYQPSGGTFHQASPKHQPPVSLLHHLLRYLIYGGLLAKQRAKLLR